MSLVERQSKHVTKNVTPLLAPKLCCAVCSNRTQDVQPTAWILMQQTDEIWEEYDGPAINHSSVMSHGTAASPTIQREKSVKKCL